MKKVYVTFAVDSRFVAEVIVPDDATTKEMLEAGQKEYENANFGEMTDIVSSEAVMIEDQDGNYLYEK